jgi:hypothetical protein
MHLLSEATRALTAIQKRERANGSVVGTIDIIDQRFTAERYWPCHSY